MLTYNQPRGGNGPAKGTTVSLLHHTGLERWQAFTCLNSLREVEPTVKLIIDDGGLDEFAAADVPLDVQPDADNDGGSQP